MLELMKNDQFLVFLAVWVLFPKFLGRLRSGLLELHKIIRLSHVVTCPVVFILFYERSYQGGVFKVMKNNEFLVLLNIGSISPSFWAG